MRPVLPGCAPPARHHDPHAAAPHGGVRLRFLQRALRPAGAPPRPAERRDGDQGVARHAAALRPRRRLGIRVQHRLGWAGDRSHRGPAPRDGDAGAHPRAPRHGLDRLRPVARHAVPRGRHARPQARRHARRHSGLGTDPRSRDPHGGRRALFDGARLHEVHPHVARRRHGPGRPRAGPRDRRDGGARPPRRHEDQEAPRGDPGPVERRRVLPRHGEVLGPDLHDQRRAGADGPPGRRARLGGAGEPLLLDRPRERHRRLLGHADPALRRSASIGGYLEFETAVYRTMADRRQAA